MPGMSLEPTQRRDLKGRGWTLSDSLPDTSDLMTVDRSHPTLNRGRSGTNHPRIEMVETRRYRAARTGRCALDEVTRSFYTKTPCKYNSPCLSLRPGLRWRDGEDSVAACGAGVLPGAGRTRRPEGRQPRREEGCRWHDGGATPRACQPRGPGIGSGTTQGPATLQ